MSGFAQPCADHEYIEPGCSACGWIAETGVEPVGWNERLLTHLEAQQAGQAMFDRWAAQEGNIDHQPPFTREDHAWADLARAAWDEVWQRRGRVDGNAQG